MPAVPSADGLVFEWEATGSDSVYLKGNFFHGWSICEARLDRLFWRNVIMLYTHDYYKIREAGTCHWNDISSHSSPEGKWSRLICLCQFDFFLCILHRPHISPSAHATHKNDIIWRKQFCLECTYKWRLTNGNASWFAVLHNFFCICSDLRLCKGGGTTLLHTSVIQSWGEKTTWINYFFTISFIEGVTLINIFMEYQFFWFEYQVLVWVKKNHL